MTSAPSVQDALRSARVSARVARGIEHLLAGAAAASAVLAAAALSGAAPDSRGALSVATLSGVLALATLAYERRESALQFARRMDGRMGAEGALATAFECEDDPGASAIARLHARRMAARFSAADLRRAVPSPSPAFLAVLLVGAALVALARQSVPASLGRTGEVASGRGLSGRSNPHSSAESAMERPHSELAAASGAHEPSSAPSGDAKASAATERMQVPGSASSAAGPESHAPGLAISTSGSSGAGSQPAEGAGSASDAGAGPGSDTRTLTETSGGSTMSGPSPEPGMPTTATAQTSASSTPASAPSGRWWPRRYDTVVARYVERTRAAQSAEPAPSDGAAPR